MAIRIISKSQQGSGAFNGGQIIENKPVGFPQDRGFVRPFSSLFYWARAEAVVDSTIGLHPHQGFEIMSFVLEGQIRHFDTKNNEWFPLNAGDVQIIRAGDGIQHAEHMTKGSVMFQIWFDPDLGKTLEQPASYDDYRADDFPVQEMNGTKRRTLIGDGSPLTMDTPGVTVERLEINGSTEFPETSGKIRAFYIIDGMGSINGESVEQDDFIIAETDDVLELKADEPIDVFAMTLPAKVSYKTYSERMASRWSESES